MRGKITAEGKLLDYEPKREKKEHKRRGSVRKKEKKKVFGILWQSTCCLYRQ